MSTRPAAAPAAALDVIHERLRAFVGKLPTASRSLLAAALLPAEARADGRHPAAAAASRNDFYWLLIPEWLAGERDARLDDVLWGQYCLYCLFRCLDDVVDGDAEEAHLAVAANVFTVEAARVLSRHLATDRGFWDDYRAAVDTTSHALIAIDRRQASAGRDGESDPSYYAALSRCLTVATRAVLTLLEREASWPRFSRLLDHLAIAGQLLDDFHDMRGDLAAGRYNYAVWRLTRPVFGVTPEATEAVIASNLASTDRLSELFGDVDRHLDSAAALVGPGDPPRLAPYIARFRRTVDGLHRAVAASRHRLFPALGPQSTSPWTSYTAATTWDPGVERTRDSRVG